MGMTAGKPGSKVFGEASSNGSSKQGSIAGSLQGKDGIKERRDFRIKAKTPLRNRRLEKTAELSQEERRKWLNYANEMKLPLTYFGELKDPSTVDNIKAILQPGTRHGWGAIARSTPTKNVKPILPSVG
jgi:hypothetical protein